MAYAIWTLVVLAVTLPACRADCPNKSVACRIPQAEQKLQVRAAVSDTQAPYQDFRYCPLDWCKCSKV
jgi:hypothetical protein